MLAFKLGLWEYIIIGLIAFFLLLSIIFGVLLIIKKKKKKNKKYDNNIETIIINLGGRENIIESSFKLSRLILELKDYSLVNKEELVKCGVDGIVTTTKKVTLVVGDLAQTIDKIIKETELK